MFRRPHAILREPTDPQKRVFVVETTATRVHLLRTTASHGAEDARRAERAASDAEDFYRPTFIAGSGRHLFHR